MTQLTKWDNARHAIAEAKSVDEVKDIRDRAEALRQYAKQAGESLTVQNDLAEIKLRAERRAGELLREMPKNEGGWREKHKEESCGNAMLPQDKQPPKLTDLGISRIQSSRFQAVAELPESEFEQHIEQTKKKRAELTEAGVLRKVKEHQRNQRRDENRRRVEETPDVSTHVNGTTYPTVVLDPPWDWGDENDQDQLGRSRPTYHTMTLAEITALPVRELSADNAHLYLWITNRSLPKGFDLLAKWDFRYITCLTWCKPQFGMGNYFRGSTEQILFGVRGSLPLLRQDVGTWFAAPRGEAHSSKPAAFYDLVQRCSPGPWLELFARSSRDGWTSWGADV